MMVMALSLLTSPARSVPKLCVVAAPAVNVRPLARRLKAWACLTSTSYVPGGMPFIVKPPVVLLVGAAERVTIFVPAGKNFTDSGTDQRGSPAGPRPWKSTEPLRLEAVVDVAA